MQDEKQFIKSLGYKGKETDRVKVRDFVSTIYVAEEDTPYKLSDYLNIKDGDMYLIVSMKIKPSKVKENESKDRTKREMQIVW